MKSKEGRRIERLTDGRALRLAKRPEEDSSGNEAFSDTGSSRESVRRDVLQTDVGEDLADDLSKLVGLLRPVVRRLSERPEGVSDRGDNGPTSSSLGRRELLLKCCESCGWDGHVRGEGGGEVGGQGLQQRDESRFRRRLLGDLRW